MAYEVRDFLLNYEKRTSTIELPHAFNALKFSDAEKEITLGDKVQPIKLFYKQDKTVRQIANIFVYTYDDQNDNESVAKGETARKLFRDELEF